MLTAYLVDYVEVGGGFEVLGGTMLYYNGIDVLLLYNVLPLASHYSPMYIGN